MKSSINKKRRTFEAIIIVALAFVWNVSVYSVSRLFTKSWHHYDMTLPIDKHIPFLPWTIIIYFGCYAFWIINYYLCAMQSSDKRDRFFCADALAKVFCFIIFVSVPTTNIRPSVANETVWDFLMRFLYNIDSADNLFPSIHCLMSWLCWVCVRRRKDIPALYRYFSLLFALAVCVSTLTTRQHVIVDVFAGVALAEFCYFVAGFGKIKNLYSKMIGYILKLLKIEQKNS